MSTTRTAHTGNTGLFITMGLAYVALLILFGIQTWLFVDWLFPNDELLMKILTVVSFDVMALLWACLESFYRFATAGTHTIVKWSWGITFLLSLIASVIYMVLQSMFRFHLEVSPQLINTAYGITITALVFNIVMITFFIRNEWMVRHPRIYEYVSSETYEPRQLAQTADAPLIDTITEELPAAPGRESTDFEHALHVYLYEEHGIMPSTWKEERKWKSYIKTHPPRTEAMEQVRKRMKV